MKEKKEKQEENKQIEPEKKQRQKREKSQYNIVFLTPKQLTLASIWTLVGMVACTAVIRLLDNGVTSLVEAVTKLF